MNHCLKQPEIQGESWVATYLTRLLWSMMLCCFLDRSRRKAVLFLTKEVEVALAEGGCEVVGVMADHLAKSSSPEEVVGRVRRCKVPQRSVSPQGSVQRALDVVEIGATDVCDREKSARDSSWVAGN